jgi:hypothetical protein
LEHEGVGLGGCASQGGRRRSPQTQRHTQAAAAQQQQLRTRAPAGRMHRTNSRQRQRAAVY